MKFVLILDERTHSFFFGRNCVVLPHDFLRQFVARGCIRA